MIRPRAVLSAALPSAVFFTIYVCVGHFGAHRPVGDLWLPAAAGAGTMLALTLVIRTPWFADHVGRSLGEAVRRFITGPN